MQSGRRGCDRDERKTSQESVIENDKKFILGAHLVVFKKIISSSIVRI